MTSSTISTSATKKGPYILLWCLSIIGAVAVIPYTMSLASLSNVISFRFLMIIMIIQTMIISGIICGASYHIVPKTDLLPFANRPSKKGVYSSISIGALLGIFIYLLDITVFKSSSLLNVQIPLYARLLASLYGGINEEVLVRLFFFTLVYFLFKKVFRFNPQNRTLFLWMTNLIVGVVFGLAHLPALFKLAAPSLFEVSRVILLNAIPGVAFGFLYWSQGLWAAMLAHFITDLMVHVVLLSI